MKVIDLPNRPRPLLELERRGRSTGCRGWGEQLQWEPKGGARCCFVDAHEHTAVHMHYARPLGHHRCPAAVWLQHPPPPGIRPGTQAGRPILSSASRSCESSGAAQFH
eukprot:COSAG04_NODE_19572_length_413_cov_0.659236_1_plen_107_part_10